MLKEQLTINANRINDMKGNKEDGLRKHSAEYRGILHTRRLPERRSVFKGIPDFRQTRIAMLRAETTEELIEILEQCRQG